MGVIFQLGTEGVTVVRCLFGGEDLVGVQALDGLEAPNEFRADPNKLLDFLDVCVKGFGHYKSYQDDLLQHKAQPHRKKKCNHCKMAAAEKKISSIEVTANLGNFKSGILTGKMNSVTARDRSGNEKTGEGEYLKCSAYNKPKPSSSDTYFMEWPPDNDKLAYNYNGKCSKAKSGSWASYILANSENTGLYKTPTGIKTGEPCPGATTTYWKDNNKTQLDGTVKKSRGSFVHNDMQEHYLSCTYNSVDSAKLLQIHSNLAADEGGESARKQVYLQLRDKYCENPENLYQKVTPTDTCASLTSGQDAARAYCAIDDNIKTKKNNCTPEQLGLGAADKLGENYCSTSPNDTWCGCYNVINGVCKTSPGAAGCTDYLTRMKTLETSGFDITTIETKPQCYTTDCGTADASRWTPMSKPEQLKCPAEFNVCNMAVEIGVNSGPIASECDIDKTAVINEAGSGVGAAGGDGDEKGGLLENMFGGGAPGGGAPGTGGGKSTMYIIIGIVILLMMMGGGAAVLMFL